jgi:hypothetical protein
MVGVVEREIGERLQHGFMCAGRQVGRQKTALGRLIFQRKRWSERQDLNLRRLGPKPSALARLSYAPIKLTGEQASTSLT